MSSDHNNCFCEDELLRGDSIVTEETSYPVSSHVRGDVTPGPLTEARFQSGISTDFASTPGVESSPVAEVKFRRIELKKEELKNLMAVSFEDLFAVKSFVKKSFV